MGDALTVGGANPLAQASHGTLLRVGRVLAAPFCNPQKAAGPMHEFHSVADTFRFATPKVSTPMCAFFYTLVQSAPAHCRRQRNTGASTATPERSHTGGVRQLSNMTIKEMVNPISAVTSHHNGHVAPHIGRCW